MPAHAHSLKLGFEFLSLRDLTWDEIGGDTVAQFASWLRAAADNVIVFDERASRRSPATVNRQLAAHLSLDNYQARAVVAVAAELANRLGRLLDVKDETHHGVAIVSAAKVRSAIRAAAQLVARAAEDLERGGARRDARGVAEDALAFEAQTLFAHRTVIPGSGSRGWKL